MSDSRIDYGELDLTSPESIAEYARHLQGMTFRDVLDLGIVPEGVEREYNNRRYKGGMGTLIEERYFGYKANSEQGPDFPEAKVELKATCFDVKKDGGISAGERLVLTMVPYGSPIEDDFFASHVWEKSSKILLVVYERDRNVDPYDQRIIRAIMFTPPAEDLKIIEDDYKKIVSIVQAGKAEELSESLTTYLGACTKGASEATMWVEQYYPPHNKAKKRAFCFKRQYMDYVLHRYVLGETSEVDSILEGAGDLAQTTFEEFVLRKIRGHFGKSDRDLCAMLGLEYSGDKAQWTKLVYALLGVRGERAEEFEKANVSVRTVRIEEEGKVRESMSLNTIVFKDLIEEEWETSPLRRYFDETRFLFVSFKMREGSLVLNGARFWSMPQSDIEGPLRDCWQRTKDVVEEGVELAVVAYGDGERVVNNLPKKKGNPIAHVRPHSSKAWYRFADGTVRGHSPSCGDVLPDGREMTKQSFWLNNDYVYGIVSAEDGEHLA